ncbi:glycosyltransferase family 9 protein [Streptomyces sp. ISL-12]|uniref:glycosyltransferase family 9 protein n=1 Tax=Streptomyces sp. ISL-12 TaxID=2819177 RepID=UPI001BE62A28|nr:glycosyltransferase family 9 protein [Streptomyces sp. ISL-12]MBT2414901.1 glycosyltransferase family 9 protein [Streptomyces sp. ISL-12]
MKALVAHPGGFGEVLLAGPAVRALATRAGTVTMLCEARGASAARLLPHVDDVLVWDTPAPDDGTDGTDGLLRRLRQEAYDVALVVGPEPRSDWPAARLLRSARVRRVATGRDGGPLGDVGDADARQHRTAVRAGAEAVLDAAADLGFGLRAGDDGRLRVRPVPDTASLTGNGPYVAVHPGAGEPRRAWDAVHGAGIVARLCDAGHRVVVTGGPEEAALTRTVSGDTAVDLGGRTTSRAFAGVLNSADLLVTASSGPAHLAAAVGTPAVVRGEAGTGSAEDVVRSVTEPLVATG